jgi:hypothetical protein
VTRLPAEDRLVVDRTDLPEYPLNEWCPVTGEAFNLERHHCWPRRYVSGWWAELRNGDVVGNIIALSPKAHERITTNRAAIVYEDGLFYWDEAGEKVVLRWQPPKYEEGKVLPSVTVTVEDVPKAKLTTLKPAVEEGSECPQCHRRVPHKKKESTPATKVYSTRVPIDDAETFKEILDAAAEHHGLKSKPYFAYWTLLYGLTLLLQQEKGELPV